MKRIFPNLDLLGINFTNSSKINLKLAQRKMFPKRYYTKSFSSIINHLLINKRKAGKIYLNLERK
jgi:hypothetical protein